MRAAIFIDGGYFLNHVKEDGGTVDYDQLATHLLAPIRSHLPIDLLRCYFYYCAPWMSDHPDEDELRRMEAHREFVDEVESTNRWQVRLGKLEKRWNRHEEYFEQKRVDVLLSVDLVRHAAAGHIQHAIIVAGDSDFIPAVAAAKESGVTVSLWIGTPKSAHQDLAWLADEIHRFDWRDFQKRSVGPQEPRNRSRRNQEPVRRDPPPSPRNHSKYR